MPRMPLSGVRISWLTMARKRDLARLAASAWSRASASARSASTRSVTSRPTLCTSVPSVGCARAHFAPRDPARACRARRSSGRARACRRRARVASPCSSTGQRLGGADRARRACLAGERAEGVVGVGDAAGGVAAHDQVALRFEQAARALFGLAQFPIAVGEIVDARFERTPIVSARTRRRNSRYAMTAQAAANSAPTPVA